ncbi:hypothetical protein [Patulibacter defluvii]|uniref:hypothetical protein n=1 Tax=Patulibacter defluvii TaxID=3095358 RepID=UPI002A74CAC2|nr:hypothetical protein [Patulibacter sp. DM4]
MTTTVTPDPLGDLGPRLRDGDPLTDGRAPELPPELLAAAADEIAATPRTTAGAARRPRSRSRSRRTSLVLALVALLGVPSAAVATYVGIHSGFFPGRDDSESTPGEEYLDTSSPGIVRVVRGLTAGVPLPPGDGWGPLLARYPADEGLMQRSGIGVVVEGYARCRWDRAYLRADAAGDLSGRERAARTLLASAGWRYTVATDGGGVAAQYRRQGRAALRGDAGPVRRHWRANCGG